MDGKSQSARWPIGSIVVTVLYWVWESRTGGNIRIDLLLISPFLVIFYLLDFWPRFKLWSILITISLMALNFGFFAVSYRLFGKNPG